MSINPVFQNHLEKLREQSEQLSNQLRGRTAKRVWMIPPGDWQGPLNIDSIGQLFDRQQSNQDYEKYMADATGIAQAAAAKLQVDILAAEGRAFRQRHKSFVRAAMHSAAVRAGHGSYAGVHIGGILQFAQDLHSSGAVS